MLITVDKILEMFDNEISEKLVEILTKKTKIIEKALKEVKDEENGYIASLVVAAFF